MDLDRIRQLIALAEETGLVELEVRSADETIRFVRGAVRATADVAAPVAAAQRLPGAGQSVLSPMAGTFYAGREPGATPLVHVGVRVVPGTVLCIIESMKMLNEIVADRAGTIGTVAVADGEPVGTGDLLFRIV